MTWSTRYAADWAMRRAPQEGQNPLRLQLNATSLSWPLSPQCRRNKPCARMPHSRKASNSYLTNSGSASRLRARCRKTPPLLIFDEATSALDGANERAIQEELRSAARNKIALVIAHRL